MATLKPTTGAGTTSGSGTGENQQDPDIKSALGDTEIQQPAEDDSSFLEFEMPIEEEERVPIACFKHRRVRRFQVGEFEFQDHFLYIYSEEEGRRFMEAWKGLMPIDKNNIVAFNWKAAQDLERPLESRALREGVTTYNIKDPKVVK